MMRLLFALGAPAVLAACADTALVSTASAPRAGFALVAETTRRATGAETAWHQSAADVEASQAKVRALVQGKSISAETAVRVALINNRRLQAAYAELGLSAADLWETALGPIPTLSLSVTNLGPSAATRTLEVALMGSLLDAATQKARSQKAELEFRAAQLEAVGTALAIAHQTRRAWVEAVGAFEAAALVRQAQETADAASELAAELGRTGAMNKADQAREHVFTAELAGEEAAAKLEAQLAKEKLTRLMGLWGADIRFYVPDRLPQLPARVPARSDLERLALANRVDLAAGRLELEQIALEHRLTQSTRMLSDIELAVGGEAERDGGTTEKSPLIEVGFAIPVYDTGKLNQRRGEMAYMRAANILAQDAINARSEARSAHAAITGTHSIARHWQQQVLPLRRTIDEEALKSYNGMLTSTFELLADAREGLEAQLNAAAARRDYWLADADARAVVWGGTATGED